MSSAERAPGVRRLQGLAWLVLAALAGPLAARGGERLWWVDVEVVGPSGSVLLRQGDAGTTQLALDLLAGERLRLSLPVPARSPLGASGLGRRPLPTVEPEPERGGTAHVLGWSDGQTAAAFESFPPGLRARPTPPLDPSRRHVRTAGLLLLALAFAVGLFLRRRRLAGTLVAAGMAALLLLVVSREGRPRPDVTVVEADLAHGMWLEVRAARERLAGPWESLGIVPDGTLALVGTGAASGAPDWVAEAPGALVVGRRRLAARTLDASRNDVGDLEATYLRGPNGTWSVHGAWPAGTPLPPAAATDAASPPGWLAAGLPPGEAVLVGRLADGRWLRATGFQGVPETLESR